LISVFNQLIDVAECGNELLGSIKYMNEL